MDFLYDESGSAYSFIYNGVQYYYVKNLQGDVVKIVNTSGNVVASYSYDAWGKVTASGSIGQINPIRYSTILIRDFTICRADIMILRSSVSLALTMQVCSVQMEILQA